MTEQWRQQMEQKLAEYREPAPTVSWDKLNQALEHGTRHRRIVTLWSRRIAAAAVVLLATVGGYWAFHSRPTVQPSIATIPPRPQAQPIARQSQQPQPITAIADRPRKVAQQPMAAVPSTRDPMLATSRMAPLPVTFFSTSSTITSTARSRVRIPVFRTA